jgi:hypothetical protein
MDRFWLVEHICSRWQGPIVFAIFHPYVNRTLISALVSGSIQPLEKMGACGDRLRHVDFRAKSADELVQYPVNKLRNLALALVKTSHFLVADIDFLPSIGLYREILEQRAILERNHTIVAPVQAAAATHLVALVVPAFSRSGGCHTVCRKSIHQKGPLYQKPRWFLNLHSTSTLSSLPA